MCTVTKCELYADMRMRKKSSGGCEFFRDHISLYSIFHFSLNSVLGVIFLLAFGLVLVSCYVSMIFIHFDCLIFLVGFLLWTKWNMINGFEGSIVEITLTKIHKSKLGTNLLKCVDFPCFLFIFTAIFCDFYWFCWVLSGFEV